MTKVVWENELDNLNKMLEGGATLKTIGEHYSVSVQRIHQVLAKHLPKWDNRRAQRLRAEMRAEEEAQVYYGNWCDRSESLLHKAQRSKFLAKKGNNGKHGLEWSIKFSEITWPSHCPILGIPINYFAEGGWNSDSPAFDRIDDNEGYVSGNVEIISLRAIRIKNDGDVREHRAIADYLEKREVTRGLLIQEQVG